jgi:hypothetical protein
MKQWISDKILNHENDIKMNIKCYKGLKNI